GYGLKLYHPHCIVLNRGTVIGENCILRQGATIGSLTDSEGREGASPVIGNNVEFGAHVVVIGPVTLGDNVKIGAGTVVTKDLAAGQVVVGQPFRVLHTHREMQE
ncbi:TPA: serine acetyltransferase, partial [Klebsiella pneumoniae]|nr:serine acetyltransferase [Klebsiella pneumoniae]